MSSSIFTRLAVDPGPMQVEHSDSISQADATARATAETLSTLFAPRPQGGHESSALVDPEDPPLLVNMDRVHELTTKARLAWDHTVPRPKRLYSPRPQKALKAAITTLSAVEAELDELRDSLRLPDGLLDGVPGQNLLAFSRVLEEAHKKTDRAEQSVHTIDHSDAIVIEQKSHLLLRIRDQNTSISYFEQMISEVAHMLQLDLESLAEQEGLRLQKEAEAEELAKLHVIGMQYTYKKALTSHPLFIPRSLTSQ